MGTYIVDNVASHIPVLDLAKRLLSVRRVLEFGSGIYSTNKLLELPNLESLTSYEDSEDWYDRIKIIKDERHHFRLDGDLLSIAQSIRLDDFDLIFIDCCNSNRNSSPERAVIIKAIAERGPRAIVIIHDFSDELERFPEAIEEFDNMVVYDKLWPATGILWNQVEGSDKVRNVKFIGRQGVLDV